MALGCSLTVSALKLNLHVAKRDVLGLGQQNVESTAQCMCVHIDFLLGEWL